MKIELSLQDDLVVVGTGTLVSQCVKWLRCHMEGNLYVFEKTQNAGSPLQKELAKLQKTPFAVADTQLEEKLLRLRPKLIFSIGNSYLFRKALIDCCPIINYHNALLPRHPGRNAEAWAIYEQDKATGITWHFVNEQVDRGAVICQRSLVLDDKITSIKLLQKQTELAFTAFQEFFRQILENQTLTAIPQPAKTDMEMHYSWEKPNDGVLDINWTAEKISAFLRAMDYGKLQRLGRPCLPYAGRTLCWQRYTVEPAASQAESICVEGQNLTIHKKNHDIRLMGIEDTK